MFLADGHLMIVLRCVRSEDSMFLADGHLMIVLRCVRSEELE